MKVLLLSDVRNVGKKGDLREVSEGYARNFLLPKKLAEIATAESIERVKQLKEEQSKKEKDQEETLRTLASTMNGLEILIRAKAEKEKLFGSIGAKEIAQELHTKQIAIEEKSIVLPEPIKTTGERRIVIDFGKNIKATITVIVEKA